MTATHHSQTPLSERLFGRCDVGDCWTFTGTRTPRGYGSLMYEGRLQPAHRVAWQVLVGPIPEGLVLHHHCRNTACINPDHLEPMTQAKNMALDTVWSSRPQRKQAHCKHGHEYTSENTYIRPDNGRRQCKACGLARKRAGHGR